MLAEDGGGYGHAPAGDGERDGPGHRGLGELPHGPSGLLGADARLGARDREDDGADVRPQVGVAEGVDGLVLDEGDTRERGDGLRRALLERDRPVADVLLGGRTEAVHGGAGGLLVHADHGRHVVVARGEEAADDGDRTCSAPGGAVDGRVGVEGEPQRGGIGLLHPVADLHRDRRRGGGPELAGQRLARLGPAHAAEVHPQDPGALVDVTPDREGGSVEAAQSEDDGSSHCHRQGNPSVDRPAAHASHISPVAPTGPSGGAGRNGSHIRQLREIMIPAGRSIWG